MPAASADGTAPLAAPRWVLPPRITWATTMLIGLGTAAYLLETEGAGASLFASAILGTLGALLVVLFRRVVPAVVLVSAIVAIICTASHVKQQTTEVLLHAFDVISLLSSWSALSHFAREHREYALGLLVAVVATAILTWMALRIDGTRIRRAPACIAAVTFFVLAMLGSMAKGERRHTEFYFENVYVSFFLASWSETIGALWRGTLIEGAPNSPAAARQNTATVCEPRPKPPHIILIHQESVVPPSHFPTLSYDRNLDPFFHSYDGQLRKLRVETFGGASWLTEFSVLTGLSTYSFGGMRQFVQQIMAGKVKDSLPHALARCGYRNVVFYPMLRLEDVPGSRVTGPHRPLALGLERAQVAAIGPIELKRRLEAGTVTLIDLEYSKLYRNGHIPGAWFATRTRLGVALEKLPPAASIVVTSPDGDLARIAAAELARTTAPPVLALEGGTRSWTAAGYPLAKEADRMAETPDDVWLPARERGGDRESAMRAYLAWEIDLVNQMALDDDQRFKVVKV
jgi:rhodanese-related sulfurtransferase/general stress protein CsbA